MELTARRMNSLNLWLTLRVHGRRAYQELIDHQMKLAHSFAEWAATSEDFELAASQVLPIINLWARATGLGPQELHALHSEVISEVNNRDGQRWIPGAVVNGQERDPHYDRQSENAMGKACQQH